MRKSTGTLGAAVTAIPENGKKRKASSGADARSHAIVATNGTTAATAVRVHRCRFIDWMPQSIQATCFHPGGEQLAVARNNGDVEIWQIMDRRWHLLYVISGSEQSKISAMVWSTSGRLFVSSLDGTLWEIDLYSLRKKNVVDSNGGPIWCMAIHNDQQALAIGCEDGRIRLFSFAHDFELFFIKGFVTTNRRVVSLAWHVGSNKLFSGNEDGMIHCWNGTSGRNESRITLESLAKQPCVVWTLLILEDLTIVSGDSHGHLSFWNGTTGTLQQKFTHLTADILALTVDTANTMLFASGVDNQVVEYRRANATNAWAYSYSHRAHSHDVRSLALSTGSRPVLVSGGVDTQLVWYPATSFNVHRPYKIASMPYRKTVSLSSEQRVLLVQKTTSLNLWQLASARHSTGAPPAQQLLVELHTGSSENIACSVLSPNGAFVAVSTANQLKLFELDVASKTFHPRKCTLPTSLRNEAARVLAFSPDSTRLVIASSTSSTLRVLDVTKMEILKSFTVASYRSPNDENTDNEPIAAVLTLAISMDGQWLSVGDADNNLSIYNLDSMQFYCHLPRPSDMHTSMGFTPSSTILVVTLVSNAFVCYDVEKKGLSTWYREYQQQLSNLTVLDSKCSIKGLAFDPTRPQYLFLYSQSSIYQINMSDRPNPATKVVSSVKKPRGARSRQSSVGQESDMSAPATLGTEDELIELEDGLCRVINRYRPLSFIDFVDDNEMMVVETPWLKVLAQLPGALYRHKYGK